MNQQKICVIAALILVAGCGSDQGPVVVADKTACGTGGTVQLSALQAATIDCSVGTTVTLSGAGASYLVVPQMATYGQPNRATPYAISVAGASASARATSTPFAPAVLGARQGPGARQRSFDAALSAFARSSSMRRMATGGQITPRATPQTQPPIGSLRAFSVLSSNDPRFTTFKNVSAKLAFAGDNILIYTDTSGAASGFTADQMNSFGSLFDQVLYTLDVNTFGAVSDIDKNGRLLILFTPVVNALSPANQCSTTGYVAGFFNPYDITSTTTNSNQGEIFYGLVPDPTAKFSCAHTASSVGTELPGVFLHEMQHLINYEQHNLVHCCSQEESWLDEGLSLIAEELGSSYYEQKYPAPTGRSNPGLLFPDSAATFILGDIADSYAYLLTPDAFSLTQPAEADVGLEMRGGAWLLLRWLGDQQGGDFFKRLETNSALGAANIESVTGKSFQSLFGNFSLALYTDSILGVPKSSIPVSNRFLSRTLRQMYQSLYNGSRTSPDVPRPFPLLVKTLTAQTTNASLMPGTMGFYRVDTGSGATATITFSTTSGVKLPASLRPQLSIFRLPPGS